MFVRFITSWKLTARGLTTALALVVASSIVPASIAQAAPETCNDRDPWNLWVEKLCLRGANIYQQQQSGDPWYPQIEPQDFVALRAAGANYVNLSVPGPYDVRTFQRRDDFMAVLDDLIDWADDAGLYAVISFRTGPGRGEADITGEGINDRSIFSADNSAAKAAYATMWEEVAERYRDRDHVVGYDLMVEPHDVPSGRWTDIATSIVDKIRTVDSVTPILISPPDWGVASSLDRWVPLVGERLVTTVHQYEPYTYTHHNTPQDWAAELESVFTGIADWTASTGQPIAINEFGVRQSATDAEAFLAMELDYLETAGYNHAAWIWEVADPTYDYRVFDVKQNPDLLRELGTRWAFNTAFPEDGTGVQFIDDDHSAFEADIEWLAGQRITLGCNPL